jgi:hypothetical protein
VDRVVCVQEMELQHPFTMQVVGPSGCGKTVFTRKMLFMLDFLVPKVRYTEIIWCYSEVGSIGDRMRNVTYHEGLPSEDMYDGTPKLVILDDLMHEMNESVAKLFTKISHHRNVSVIMLMQNLFPRNKDSRNIGLNSNYIVVFKNWRDQSQMNYFARQVCPNDTKFFLQAFEQATADDPHGYLCVVFKPGTADCARFVDDIFHEDMHVRVPFGFAPSPLPELTAPPAPSP